MSFSIRTLTFLLALTMARALVAATISIVPNADTFVGASVPNNNYGFGGAMDVSAPDTAKGEYQSLFRFNLNNFAATFDSIFGPGGWTLQSVQLRLTSTPPNNVVFNNNAAGTVAAAWMQNDSWVEGTGVPIGPTTDGITWNTLPGYLSAGDQSMGTLNYAGGNSGVNTYTLTPTTGFMNDLNTGSLATIRLSPTSAGVSTMFNSRNYSTPSDRPQLMVTAIPEPAFALSSLALAALLLPRR